jgi:tetratricopeptide (TPR) repeat protein
MDGEMDNNELTTLGISEVADPTLSRSQRAMLCCQQARQLERAGEYERGCRALHEFWPNSRGPLVLEGLDELTRAELLLRAGALTGWAGSARQVEDAQERAKDLISRSIEIFEQLGETSRAAGARSDLALCYWRQGAFDEARLVLRDTLARLTENDRESELIALIRLGMLEKAAGRYSDSLNAYSEAAQLVEGFGNHAIKGTFHNELAGLLTRLGEAEESESRLDRALVEYAAASYHFEQAGHLRFRACVENNLAFLLIRIKRFADAHAHLDCARGLWLQLKDVKSVGQSDDTRARALLAEGRLAEAEAFARQSVAALEGGGEHSILAEALTTRGVVLARMGKLRESRTALNRAIEVARASGDPEGAGRAALSFMEELSPHTPNEELVSIYQSAVELLEKSQDPLTGKRLISCANTLISSLGAPAAEAILPEQNWEGFSLKHQMLQSEKNLIQRALIDSGGVVSRAALLLGFRHHQSLIALINSRHRDLLAARSPVKTRRRSVMWKLK